MLFDKLHVLSIVKGRTMSECVFKGRLSLSETGVSWRLTSTFLNGDLTAFTADEREARIGAVT